MAGATGPVGPVLVSEADGGSGAGMSVAVETVAAAAASAVANINCRAIGATGYARTGRFVDAPYAHALFTTCATREEMVAHPTFREFLGSIRDLPLRPAPLECFRGVAHVKPGNTPSEDDLGPPPAGMVVPVGRYNEVGTSRLYLADSVDGVARELKGRGEGWCARFVLDPTSLRIADVTEFNIMHPANVAMWCAEIANQYGDKPEEYVWGQLVAECMARKFDAMIMRGVHGAESAHYRNVIVFRPGTAWRAWRIESPWRTRF